MLRMIFKVSSGRFQYPSKQTCGLSGRMITSPGVPGGTSRSSSSTISTSKSSLRLPDEFGGPGWSIRPQTTMAASVKP